MASTPKTKVSSAHPLNYGLSWFDPQVGLDDVQSWEQQREKVGMDEADSLECTGVGGVYPSDRCLIIRTGWFG